MADGAPEVFKGGNVRKGRAQTKGKPEEAMAKADAMIEGTYSAAGHHPRLPRAPRADRQVGRPRQADRLGEHPGGAGRRRRAGRRLQHPRGQRHGAHRGAWAAASAPSSAPTSGAGPPPSWPRRRGRPVKLFLDRVQEHLAGGNRPSASGKIKLGATKDGKLVAMIAETHGTGGSRGGSNFPLPYVYDVPDSARTHTEVFVNCGGARAMRAPGHPQGCALMEAAMDDLADKLGIDPAGVPAQEPGARRLPDADLRGRGQDRGRADRLEREAQAARPERQRPDPPRPGHGPAPVGRRRHAGQEGHLHHQPRRLGRAQDGHPGPRHRHPDRPGDHRRRGPRAQADRHHLEHRQLDASRRASPRAARRPPRRWPRRASTR